MVDCEHKETYVAGLGSLWGPFERFCSDCGFCTTNSEVPARPEAAKKHREMEESFRKAVERLEAMTPEEKAEYDKKLLEKLRAGRKDLEKQLRPFRQRHNCLRRCTCSMHRRLD